MLLTFLTSYTLQASGDTDLVRSEVAPVRQVVGVPLVERSQVDDFQGHGVRVTTFDGCAHLKKKQAVLAPCTRWSKPLISVLLCHLASEP